MQNAGLKKANLRGRVSLGVHTAELLSCGQERCYQHKALGNLLIALILIVLDPWNSSNFSFKIA